jgi:hypothetical protein
MPIRIRPPAYVGLAQKASYTVCMASGERLNGSGKVHTHDDSESPPEAVSELAAGCQRFVASRYGVELDFTQDTLPLVDQYLRDAKTEAGAHPETIPLLAASVGAYLGEVMRRELGAFWFADGDHSAWRLYFTHVYLACNPLGMVLEALDPELAEGWHAHFEIDPADADVVASRLAAIPEVEAEVYSLPTTRMEALTIVYEALRSHMEAQNAGDVRFGPDDYR